MLPQFELVAKRFMADCPVWGNYTHDLGLEALLRLADRYDIQAYKDFFFGILNERWAGLPPVRAYQSQAFCCLEDAIYQSTKDPIVLERMTETTFAWKVQAPRSREGLLLHERKGEASRVLLDGVQEYAARCIRNGIFIKSSELIHEGFEQWQLHHDLLCDLTTGFWSQGRGWLPDVDQLSPGAWSRGQAWVIRGLVRSLEFLPVDAPEYPPLRRMLQLHVEQLLQVQGSDGFWHRLLDCDVSGSLPDSSATGMIVYYLERSLELRICLPSSTLREALNCAAQVLLSSVDADGNVLHSCPGPGPLVSDQEYLGETIPDRPGEPHGAFALLLAAQNR